MFEIVTLNKIQEILDPIISQYLARHNFIEQEKLQWIRSDDAPIRQLFAFRQWKGGAVAPAWGLSLDFVPHLSGNTLKWHRTPKSALFDLTIDARDRDLDISYIGGEQIIVDRAEHVVSKAVLHAIQFWDRYRTIQSLPCAVDEMRSYLTTCGLGFHNYSQAPIAAAFILALNGRKEEATAEINAFYNRQQMNQKARDRLQELFDKTNSIPKEVGAEVVTPNGP